MDNKLVTAEQFNSRLGMGNISFPNPFKPVEKDVTLNLNDMRLLIMCLDLVAHRTEKVWGWEYEFVNEPEYCTKVLALKPGYSSSLHRHHIKRETFVVLQGDCYLAVENEVRSVKQGDRVTIEPGWWHKFFHYGNDARKVACFMLESSMHHDDADVERKEASCKL